MNIDTTITVFMPVYNAEKTLHIAIESILNQTYQNFEFLIIDDGSTDGSAEIIRSYNDARIKFIENDENLGVQETSNKGLTLASNELIARMDADDYSYPERLEKQLHFFNDHPDCSALASWAREMDFNDQVINIERINPEFYYYNLNFECWIYQPTIMFKRSAVIDVGEYQTKYSEDFDLWWRLTRKYKLYVLPEVLLDYRSSDNSLSRVTRKKEYEDAHMSQLIRNIRYYTGDNFELKEYEAEFLRSYVEPAIQIGTDAIISSFNKLDYITDCILAKETEGHDSIRKAALFKKTRSIRYLNDYLDQKTIFKILIQLRYWSLLKTQINKLIYKKLSFLKK